MDNSQIRRQAQLYHGLVYSFNTRFNLPRPKWYGDSSTKGRALYGGLIHEEYQELLAATSPLETLDAYCDIVYVAIGGMIAAGISADTLLVQHEPSFLLNVAQAIKELNKEQPCQSGLTRYLPGAVITSIIQGYNYNKNFFMAFEDVQRNNMRKLWTKDEIIDLNPEYNKELPGDKSAGWVVSRRKDGKVMKPPGFTPVDLTPYVTFDQQLEQARRPIASSTSPAHPLPNLIEADALLPARQRDLQAPDKTPDAEESRAS